MKVQCEQCGAAYSVADDKVAGRKLKQKCRKCGEPLVIDGTTVHEHETALAPIAKQTAPGDAPEWHIAVGDTTQGPYTLQELAQYYEAGSLVLDTLVCRDGWDDWKQASEVPELLEAVRGPALVSMAPPPRKASIPPAVPAHALGQAAAMGRDPFAEPAELSPRISIEELATPGVQRDSTVQFSMDQIRALSSVSAPSLPPSAPSKPGHAAADGSGLIDMKALAEAESKAAASAAEAAMSSSNQGYRQLTASQIGPLEGLSPLTLSVQRKPGIDFRTKVLAAVAAFAVVLAGTVGVLALQRTEVPVAQPVVLQAPPEVQQPPVMAAIAPPAASAPDTSRTAPTPGDEQASADVDAEPRDRPGKGGRKGGSRSGGARGSYASQGGGGKSAPADDIESVLAAKTDAPKRGGTSNIDDLLDGAISGKRTAPKDDPGPERASSLPQTPGRDQMLAALTKAKAKAAKCKGSGVATAAITISGKSGKATSINVSGVDGAAKSCVEKAVRSTGFPKFQKDSFDVKFPFKIGG